MILRGRVWKYGDNIDAGGGIVPPACDALFFAGKLAECVPLLLHDVDP